MNYLLSMVFAISLVCSSASANSLETVYPQKDSIELRLEKMIEKYGKKKDVWSVGVMTYELLFGPACMSRVAVSPLA